MWMEDLKWMEGLNLLKPLKRYGVVLIALPGVLLAPSAWGQDILLEPAPGMDDRRPAAEGGLRLQKRAKPERNVRLFLRPNPGFTVPTALQGAGRPRAVLPGSLEINRLAVAVRPELVFPNGDNLAVVMRGGFSILAADLGFVRVNPETRRGFAVNVFNQRSQHPAFYSGEDEVNLPNGDTPWIHRLGGGVETFIPLGAEIDSALGLSYQRVSVRDGMFNSRVENNDEDGNALTVDNDGIDDVLTLNYAIAWDRRDSGIFPRQGFRTQLGVDQGFTLGQTSIAFTRLSANYAQFIPVNFLGFTEGPRTVILNVQAGTMLGDVPPYEAFTLGGSSAVRGYSDGELGTGRSFVVATVEYRYPIANVQLFSNSLALRGNVFVDYGTTLGSQDDVIGTPGAARDKPGEGLGFGLGLLVEGGFGLGRLEFGFNSDGGSTVSISVGDRF